MGDTKKIHYNSPEAATYRTDIRGWVSAKGLYCGDHGGSEHVARYNGATHRDCEECGAEIEIRYMRCEACCETRRNARYAALEAAEWDGETPLAIFDDDTYFFSHDELIGHCEANDIELADLQLLICVPVMGRQFGIDDFYDDLPEDAELPKSIWEAVENLNKVIKAHGPMSWYPGKVRAIVKLEARHVDP